MKKIILISALLLTACDQDPGYLEQANKSQSANNIAVSAKSDRFTLLLAQSFKDYDAYNNRRSIYILTDKETGKEYLGISGIGISELGSHAAGKAVITDER